MIAIPAAAAAVRISRVLRDEMCSINHDHTAVAWSGEPSACGTRDKSCCCTPSPRYAQGRRFAHCIKTSLAYGAARGEELQEAPVQRGEPVVDGLVVLGVRRMLRRAEENAGAVLAGAPKRDFLAGHFYTRVIRAEADPACERMDLRTRSVRDTAAPGDGVEGRTCVILYTFRRTRYVWADDIFVGLIPWSATLSRAPRSSARTRKDPKAQIRFSRTRSLAITLAWRQPTQMPCSPSTSKAFCLKNNGEVHGKVTTNPEISDGPRPSQDALRLVRKRRRLNDT